eukprot:CAMPEP_0194266336 /NCGR_PEP_ID=MMETSP0169-20130528/1272_1 /TAXON_ID=218684 /ORGANISM="Corethron pennatum, Strain L29A3" /LENGTH=612 /DNA_ID=CAMNT_0039006997 /DNA_START=8 /DNA_END=1846 /DNA_ORIENTATION=+
MPRLDPNEGVESRDAYSSRKSKKNVKRKKKHFTVRSGFPLFRTCSTKKFNKNFDRSREAAETIASDIRTNVLKIYSDAAEAQSLDSTETTTRVSDENKNISSHRIRRREQENIIELDNTPKLLVGSQNLQQRQTLDHGDSVRVRINKLKNTSRKKTDAATNSDDSIETTNPSDSIEKNISETAVVIAPTDPLENYFTRFMSKKLDMKSDQHTEIKKAISGIETLPTSEVHDTPPPSEVRDELSEKKRFVLSTKFRARLEENLLMKKEMSDAVYNKINCFEKGIEDNSPQREYRKMKEENKKEFFTPKQQEKNNTELLDDNDEEIDDAEFHEENDAELQEEIDDEIYREDLLQDDEDWPIPHMLCSGVDINESREIEVLRNSASKADDDTDGIYETWRATVLSSALMFTSVIERGITQCVEGEAEDPDFNPNPTSNNERPLSRFKPYKAVVDGIRPYHIKDNSYGQVYSEHNKKTDKDTKGTAIASTEINHSQLETSFELEKLNDNTEAATKVRERKGMTKQRSPLHPKTLINRVGKNVEAVIEKSCKLNKMRSIDEWVDYSQVRNERGIKPPKDMSRAALFQRGPSLRSFEMEKVNNQYKVADDNSTEWVLY